jgi:hypothetical protein
VWAPVEIASARFVWSALSVNRLGDRAIDVHHAGKQLVGTGRLQSRASSPPSADSETGYPPDSPAVARR